MNRYGKSIEEGPFTRPKLQYCRPLTITEAVVPYKGCSVPIPSHPSKVTLAFGKNISYSKITAPAETSGEVRAVFKFCLPHFVSQCSQIKN